MAAEMKDLLIREDKYEEVMEQTVYPDLESRREILWPEREAGEKICCAFYRTDQPRGMVLISHGFTETAEKYPEVIYYFLRMGYHVACMEHCGHGRSYRLVEDLSLVHIDRYQRYIGDLIFTAEKVKEREPGLPLFLYGHSMGGGIAAAVAAASPGLFEKVILSSPMIRAQTPGVPWRLAMIISELFCLIGKGTDYVAGQRPYSGSERFEDSASMSRPRFDAYQQKRKAEPLFQMSAASYGWLANAGRLYRHLMRKACRQIRMPMLVFQAEQDAYVSNREMGRFVEKAGGTVLTVKTTGTKHEIYNSRDEVLETYWEMIFSWLDRI